MRTTAAALAILGLLTVGLIGTVAPALAAEPAVPTAVATSPSARLSSGGWGTCYVVSNGDVRCWGNGSEGQLGDAILKDRIAPVAVLSVHDATEVRVGPVFACARRATGGVVCWGDDTYGQLGDGGPGTAYIARPVPGVSGALAIAVGLNHACALLAGGTVTCWGRNDDGQLGRPIFAGPMPAATVSGISGATAIATGYNHTCAVLADGTARCWGDNTHKQLGNAGAAFNTGTPQVVIGLSGATAISGGTDFTCAVVASGGVRCWGRNGAGQLGNGAVLPGPDSSDIQTVVNVSGAVAVSAGFDHACALAATGTVSCWGGDIDGQLGSTGSTSSSTPITVPGVSATAIAAGYVFSCALKAPAGVTCWGGNYSGALGRYTSKAFPNPPGDVVGDLIPGAMAVGAYHTCTLTAVGTVQCWGDNSTGQLGIGSSTTMKSSTARTVSGLSGVVALSSGSNHSCAVLSSGAVRCWGDGSSGQLGDGASGVGHKALAPVPVSGLTDAIAISAGGDHTCAIRRTLTAVCWGGNASGQLGDNSQSPSATPQAVQSLAHIAQISAGSGHTCAIRADATAWCWGDNGAGQLAKDVDTPRSLLPVEINLLGTTPLSNVVQVVARYAHSCALLADGGVMCWGNDGWGELGQGQLTGGSHLPLAVTGLGTSISIGPANNHGVHECAIQSNATIRCWGANDQGQLGKGAPSTTESTPVLVTTVSSAVQVSLGFQDSCALLASGAVECWGNNDDWQLGSTAASPVSAPIFVDSFSVSRRALAIDAGTSHTCALVENATARCWGAGGSGRLGNGSTSNRTTPVLVLAVFTVTAISAGGAHSCAVALDGTAHCWGSDTYGQLGNNATVASSTPVTVSGLSGVVAISAGGNHTCALISNGTVKCWGLNSSGQLGDGTTTSRHTPVTVKTSSTTTLTSVIAISAGTSHTCALLSNGTARCWGAGGSGRLGNGSTSNRTYASAVSGVTTSTATGSRFTSISAGGAHTCARIANGTAKCWGSGGNGRLGNASTSSHSTPVTVSSLTSVAQISAGGAHTCAVISNGTAKCWGYNAYGQLGNNSTTSRTTPVTVSGLSAASSISAGGNHTAAGLGTGSLRGWGLNTSGQLGDGTFTNRHTPRAVSGF